MNQVVARMFQQTSNSGSETDPLEREGFRSIRLLSGWQAHPLVG
jgi:hypothetical protein